MEKNCSLISQYIYLLSLCNTAEVVTGYVSTMKDRLPVPRGSILTYTDFWFVTVDGARVCQLFSSIGNLNLKLLYPNDMKKQYEYRFEDWDESYGLMKFK